MRMRLSLITLVVPALLAALNPEWANLPKITIDIPSSIRSETIQVFTFLRGPFGGSATGPDLKPPNLRVIEINASHNGQAATDIAVTAYMPDCEFVSIKMLVSKDFNPVQRLVCTPLPKTSLSGTIPAGVVGNRQAELVLQYRAFWAAPFGDGGIPTFEIARVVSTKDGRFDFDISDYSALSNSPLPFSGGDFVFGLRETKTLNWLVSTLVPEDPDLKMPLAGMKVQSHYPKGLKLVPDSPIR
jgi:hypothetical protein